MDTACCLEIAAGRCCGRAFEIGPGAEKVLPTPCIVCDLFGETSLCEAVLLTAVASREFREILDTGRNPSFFEELEAAVICAEMVSTCRKKESSKNIESSPNSSSDMSRVEWQELLRKEVRKR